MAIWNISLGSCVPGTWDCSTNSNHHYFWQAGTTNVYHSSSANHGSGHSVPGYNRWWNADAFPKAYTRNFNNPTVPTLWPGTYPSPCCSQDNESHFSWNKNNSSDTGMILAFAAGTTLGSAPTFNTPLVNEIYGYMQDGTSGWRRFAHCCDTGTNPNFFDSQCTGSISQDGKWAVWSSDWLGTLGGRIDVFVVKLQ